MQVYSFRERKRERERESQESQAIPSTFNFRCHQPCRAGADWPGGALGAPSRLGAGTCPTRKAGDQPDKPDKHLPPSSPAPLLHYSITSFFFLLPVCFPCCVHPLLFSFFPIGLSCSPCFSHHFSSVCISVCLSCNQLFNSNNQSEPIC